MKTIRLGKTNLSVSRIGIGGIPIQRPPEETAIKVLQRCFDLGISYIDTSIAYGTSEERIGKAIPDYRDDIVIATKTGWRDKEMANECLEKSLTNLQTDYIDIWQFHNVSTPTAFKQIFKTGGAMEAAQQALEEGKINHIGISTHSLEIARTAITSGEFSIVLFPFNFIRNEPADELISLAQKHDVGFVAMKPFAGGSIKNANIAIKYLLQYDSVLPVAGIEKISEIEEIVEIVKGSWTLTPRDQEVMKTTHSQLDKTLCRQCGECQPCPQGVHVQMLMITKGMWRLWPREEFLNRWMPPSVKSWSKCDHCEECEDKCPYHLPVRQIISENIEFYKKVAQGMI
ncbi:MAG: aldo/keto reductase [Candidatus Heimdallarchaeota archaeon]|nr:MAG: aldo/keto reductase [Candidatus Heimdallarchaeota archaeon]